MVQNAEFVPPRIVRRQLNLRLRAELLRHFKPGDESRHFAFRYPTQALQVVQLRVQLVVGPVKPIPLSRSPMYTKRSADSIAKFRWPELILSRKHLNSFSKPRSAFDRHLQPNSEIVDIDRAISC